MSTTKSTVYWLKETRWSLYITHANRHNFFCKKIGESENRGMRVRPARTKWGLGQPVLTRSSRPWTRVSGRAVIVGCRTCSPYPIRADDVIIWYHSLSTFWRIRRHRALIHLPCFRFSLFRTCTTSCQDFDSSCIYVDLCHGFSSPPGTCHPWVDSSCTYPEARHALTGAVFYMSKMRAHVAADARVTSGALYL